MLDRGVIKPCQSSWASPVVLVTKKDGTTRLCVDYRKLNDVSKKDTYPFPRIDDALDALHGSMYFSTLDLYSGYWQVEMDQRDIDKTAFVTRQGLFRFTVMPFGLCNAPATFERLMELVLKDLNWKICLIYLDDIIFYGAGFYPGSSEDNVEKNQGIEFEAKAHQVLPDVGAGSFPRAHRQPPRSGRGPNQDRGR